MLPDYFYHYSKHSDYQKRVDQIIQWLSLPKAQRPRLVVSYFSLVDSMGHEFGPDAKETYDAVQKLDSLMADLSDPHRAEQLAEQLVALPGVIEATMVNDENRSYLKVNDKEFDINQAKQILGLN